MKELENKIYTNSLHHRNIYSNIILLTKFSRVLKITFK